MSIKHYRYRVGDYARYHGLAHRVLGNVPCDNSCCCRDQVLLERPGDGHRFWMCDEFVEPAPPPTVYHVV